MLRCALMHARWLHAGLSQMLACFATSAQQRTCAICNRVSELSSAMLSTVLQSMLQHWEVGNALAPRQCRICSCFVR